MNVTIRQLRIFMEVAQQRSMIRAARTLHLTPPAISVQIREIEIQLGLALFNRGRKQVTLSMAGEYFLGYAQRVLADYRETEIAIARFKRLERGLLTIGIAGVAEHVVPQMLARFHCEHPQIDVRIRVVHNRDRLIASMDAGEIDLSVMGRPPKELGVRSEAFGFNPLVFVCAPKHPILAERRLSIRSLIAGPLIVREQGSGARTAMDALLARHRHSPASLMEISSNQTIKHAVMAGMGLGFLSLHTVDLELRCGLLKALNVRNTPVMSPWNIVHLHARMLSPAAEAFREFIIHRGAKDLRAHNAKLLSVSLNRRRSTGRGAMATLP